MVSDKLKIGLSLLQRRLIVELAPEFASRMDLTSPHSRTLSFTLSELKRLHATIAVYRDWIGGMRGRALENIMASADRALHKACGLEAIPVRDRLYQFRIALQGVEPAIWRRIQVKRCTLDKLHEHIQTAMGWTNSHLHQFEARGLVYGDPQLLLEGWANEPQVINSLETSIDDILPEDGQRFTFDYEYDFGDRWRHTILFEGCLHADNGGRYPLCVEGDRCCPPEDVGGVSGYEDFLKILARPEHEDYESTIQWSGPFDSAEFDADSATRRMKKGIFDWRAKAAQEANEMTY